jgi:hypothetical protein
VVFPYLLVHIQSLLDLVAVVEQFLVEQVLMVLRMELLEVLLYFQQ